MVNRTISRRPNGADSGRGLATVGMPLGVTFPSLTRVFGDFLSDPMIWGEDGAGAQGAVLALDVSEDDKNVIVRASVPGFAKDEIDVQVVEGTLLIGAQHQEESSGPAEGNERYHRRERRVGTLSRQITLPANVVADQTQAALKDGVLTLRLPKTPEAQPRKIKIG